MHTRLANLETFYRNTMGKTFPLGRREESRVVYGVLDAEYGVFYPYTTAGEEMFSAVLSNRFKLNTVFIATATLLDALWIVSMGLNTKGELSVTLSYHTHNFSVNENPYEPLPTVQDAVRVATVKESAPKPATDNVLQFPNALGTAPVKSGWQDDPWKDASKCWPSPARAC